jgi:aryl-alcohol dehydrogenase-like predicted oxidoreductase
MNKKNMDVSNTIKLNRLVLGTAQLGMEYGINNKSGKPDLIKALEIIRRAFEAGILTFDTAGVYGEAEAILGQAVITFNLKDRIKVISKLPANIGREDRRNIGKEVEAEVHRALKRINLEILDGYLLHNPLDLRNPEIMDALEQCRKKGMVKHLGVSIYEEKEALDATESKAMDYIQIPYNIFDQRLNKTNFFDIAGGNDVKIFARSPFLQGLLLMEAGELPGRLSAAKIYLKELDIIINKYGYSRLEAALLFSYTDKNVDHVVFGIDNSEQLNDIIRIAGERSENFSACKEELTDRFADVEKDIIMPNRWKK